MEVGSTIILSFVVSVITCIIVNGFYDAYDLKKILKEDSTHSFKTTKEYEKVAQYAKKRNCSVSVTLEGHIIVTNLNLKKEYDSISLHARKWEQSVDVIIDAIDLMNKSL